MNNFWIFHASPKRYDLFSCLKDPEYKGQITWNVKQHQMDIAKEDTVLIWLSGQNAGIYATGKVISDPERSTGFPWEDKYWLKEADRGKKCLNVIVEILRDMTHAPLYRNDLKKIPELQHLGDLNPWQKTNIPVSRSDWEKLKAVIL